MAELQTCSQMIESSCTNIFSRAILNESEKPVYHIFGFLVNIFNILVNIMANIHDVNDECNKTQH